MNGSSTVATNFKPSSLADNRWETYEVASADQVSLNIGVGMVEQPLSKPRAAIAEPVGGGRPFWLCAACGRRYIHTINPSKDLVHGQDLAFNYIVFLQFKLGDGVRTLCAMAQAPSELLQTRSSRSNSRLQAMIASCTEEQ